MWSPYAFILVALTPLNRGKDCAPVRTQHREDALERTFRFQPKRDQGSTTEGLNKHGDHLQISSAWSCSVTILAIAHCCMSPPPPSPCPARPLQCRSANSEWASSGQRGRPRVDHGRAMFPNSCDSYDVKSLALSEMSMCTSFILSGGGGGRGGCQISSAPAPSP